jgi:signal transduction histidine kinase
VIDDARLIAAPVSFGGQIMGLLIGYSARTGTFTAADLEKLMAYSHVAAGILTHAAIEAKSEMRTTFTTDELSHHSRLITMGQLSACFAHEVRNPLTLINGHLRFIQDSLTTDHPLRTNLEVIERSSRRIEEMAKRMLDFGRKKTRRVARCDIGELITDALRFVQPYFRSDLMDVQVSLEPQLSLILADRWQMVQAFVNLLLGRGSRRRTYPESSSHFSLRRETEEPASVSISPNKSLKSTVGLLMSKPTSAERASSSASLFRLLGAGITFTTKAPALLFQ